MHSSEAQNSWDEIWQGVHAIKDLSTVPCCSTAAPQWIYGLLLINFLGQQSAQQTQWRNCIIIWRERHIWYYAYFDRVDGMNSPYALVVLFALAHVHQACLWRVDVRIPFICDVKSLFKPLTLNNSIMYELIQRRRVVCWVCLYRTITSQQM